MNLSRGTWLPLAACALALPGLSAAQDDQMTPVPPPPQDQTEDGDQPAPYEAPGQAPAPGQDQDISFQTFYDTLSSQGTWIQSSDYGYVWQPDVNDPDWAPYTEGNWAYSDDGWTWVSDESWGWATYHYGRWVNLTGRGWCWVPGYTWAPAWVSWRYGGGYCGWAPLPPDSFYGIDYFDGETGFTAGFHIGGDCDFFFGIGAGCYCFVPVTCLGYSNYHGCYEPRANNFAIINHTTNVTNINVSRNGAAGGSAFGGVSVGGPSLAQVNAVAKTPVERVSLVASSRPGGGVVSGHSLMLFAPDVDPATRATSRPVHVAATIGHAAINRGTDVTRPLAVNRQLVPAAPTQAQVERTLAAQSHAPAGAKVVTAHTVIQPVFNQPLTSLRTLPGTAVTSRSAPVNAGPVVVAPQPAVSRQQGGSVVYPQGQVYQTPPGTVYHSSQPSNPLEHEPSHDTSSNESSAQPGGNYQSGNSTGGGYSGSYHSGGGSGGNSGGGGYHGGGNGGNGQQQQGR